MSELVYILCDECGDRVPDYAYDPKVWTETDDGEDLCPHCALLRSERPAADAPAP